MIKTTYLLFIISLLIGIFIGDNLRKWLKLDRKQKEEKEMEEKEEVEIKNE